MPCYSAIHGLPFPKDARANAIFDRALPRFARLFEDENIPATFFIVARDLEREANAARVRALHAAGHEIGSHSFSHYYDLTRRPRATLESEVRRATIAIENAVSTRPLGFRAPGYTVTNELLEILASDGYLYDSSVFPCPAYFAAKAAAIGWHGLRGRESRSIVDTPHVLRAPADPYRIGARYFERGEGLLELPIGVTRDSTLRLPFIGTFVALGGVSGAERLARAAVGRPFVNLELHGIDLADADDDALEFLRPYQADLRVARAAKEAALRATIRVLREEGYRFVTTLDAARRFAAH